MNPNSNNNYNKRKPNIFLFVAIGVVVLAIILFSTNIFQKPSYNFKNNYNDLHNNISHISNVKYSPVGGTVGNAGWYNIEGTFTDKIVFNDTEYSNFKAVLNEEELKTFKNDLLISNNNVILTFASESTFSFWDILFSILPILLIVVFIVIMMRNANKGNNQAFDFGKSRARLVKGKQVTFNDVAGADEEKQELEEIIDFLKHPKKYVEMGAKIPKGVLLVGAPGTGKTLLAKATSGEAGVPFFSISGSDFVEMFVGVGASRVRDLFKIAKENAPCIVFIDEIDAVGRQRGTGLGGGHDEREQTLNQLLVEMDGFNNNLGIIVIAATNRADVLDPALLRPGRFDRQITIDLPDLLAREQILKVHARNKKIDPNINYNNIAARIPGFSGADIANVLNEAALLATRENRNFIIEKDIDEAIDRVMMGPAKKSKKYNPEEKRLVSYHEAGHAVIGLKLSGAKIVQKVTIIPRGRAGGYNLMTDAKETYYQPKESLLANITGYYGGRAAEDLIFNTISTGAYGDIEAATMIARAMVTEFGMSELGPIQYEKGDHNVFLGRDYFQREKNFSDDVANKIDHEVNAIVTQCYNQAKALLVEHRELLDKIAYYLMEIETLNKADIDEIVQTGHISWWDERKANENIITINSATDSENSK
jgi:cell division protease FtsH